MADTKISDLAAVTALIGTDELVLARSGDTKKVTASDFAASLGAGGDGWNADLVTWTYASASTFTVTGDLTAQFSKGTRLKFTQTTEKYAVVRTSSHAAGTTTVTIATNTDYTIANAAITDPYFSYVVNPQGYPRYFNYAPTWASSGTQPVLNDGTLAGRYQLYGDECVLSIRLVTGASTTYGTGTYTLSYPIAEADIGSTTFPGFAYAFDTSVSQHFPAFVRGGFMVTLAVVPATFWSNTVPFTWASGDSAEVRISYRI